MQIKYSFFTCTMLFFCPKHTPKLYVCFYCLYMIISNLAFYKYSRCAHCYCAGGVFVVILQRRWMTWRGMRKGNDRVMLWQRQPYLPSIFRVCLVIDRRKTA